MGKRWIWKIPTYGKQKVKEHNKIYCRSIQGNLFPNAVYEFLTRFETAAWKEQQTCFHTWIWLQAMYKGNPCATYINK